MSSTLRSIAEKETSEVIQIVRQEEDHVARMENAGVELSMLVESGQLKLAFPRVQNRLGSGTSGTPGLPRPCPGYQGHPNIRNARQNLMSTS